MKTLVISDLHLGSGRSLAYVCRELLEPELEWADRLLINGDLIHTAPLASVLLEAEPWCQFVSGYVGEVALIPGNHEYGLLGQGRRRVEMGLSDHVTGECLGLLQHLFPSASVSVHHPRVRVEGVEVVHGHQLIAQVNHTRRLSLSECDALIGPYFEAFWVISQQPEAMTSPLFEALIKEMGRITPSNSPVIRPLEECLKGMAQMMKRESVPEGRVVFGHLHQQVEDGLCDGYLFSNPGGWLLDSYVQQMDPDFRSAHPGGVIRISEGLFEHRRLLDGLSPVDLEKLILA